MGFTVQGLGGLGIRGWGLGFRVWGLCTGYMGDCDCGLR